MPGLTLHLDLAERTVACAGSGGLPFDPRDPEARNAFRQGAFGPDLGYFPGGWRPLSDLAHCVRAGDLARALVRRARTPAEAAFAAGWVTHLLADHAIHPLIGCAVGEVLHGRPTVFVCGDDHPAAHVRVEAGLDARWAARRPSLRRLPLTPAFDARSIGFLRGAFHDTHEVHLPEAALLRSHRAVAVRAPQGLRLAGWTAARLDRSHGRSAGPGVGPGPAGLRERLCRALGHSAQPLAMLLPVRPPRWLESAARAVVRKLPELVLEELASGLAGVANWNLDTGRDESADPHHGGRLRGLALLGRLRATGAASGTPPTPVREAA